MIKKSFLLLLASLFLFSCEQTKLEPNTALLGFQFYPISVGDQHLYEVEEINYRNTGEIDTIRYQLIDNILDSLSNGATTSYTGLRFIRQPNGQEEILSTITIEIDEYSVLRRLGNTKEIIFTFPVKEAKEWDALPSIEESDSYSYFRAFQPFALNDSVFNQSVQVIEEDNQDSLEFLDTRISVFAENTGPLYRLSSQIEFCTLSECFGLKEIEIGKTIRMTRVFD